MQYVDIHQPGESVLLGAYVPPSLKERFVRIARENDRTASAELRVVLRRYVAESAAVLHETKQWPKNPPHKIDGLFPIAAWERGERPRGYEGGGRYPCRLPIAPPLGETPETPRPTYQRRPKAKQYNRLQRPT